jgi:hypothetical protein
MYNGHITDAVFGLGRVEIRSIIVLTRRCFVAVGFLDDDDDDDDDVVDVDDEAEEVEEKDDDERGYTEHVGIEQV